MSASAELASAIVKRCPAAGPHDRNCPACLGLARGHIKVLAELGRYPASLARILAHIAEAAAAGESLIGARLTPECIAYGVPDGAPVWRLAGARRALPPPLQPKAVGQVIPLFRPAEDTPDLAPAASVARR